MARVETVAWASRLRPTGKLIKLMAARQMTTKWSQSLRSGTSKLSSRKKVECGPVPIPASCHHLESVVAPERKTERGTINTLSPLHFFPDFSPTGGLVPEQHLALT